MRKLAVYINFSTPAHQARIRQLAQRLGFQADFFSQRDEAILDSIESYEVLFGYPPPGLVRRAKNLRWLASAAAGIEQFLREGALPNPECLLTNGSGAYGPTISEHILMVLLMLLRRMPEYQAAAAEQRWPYLSPVRSITGGRFVLLGTGDIGSNTARRLHALGASVTGVSRSGQSREPAFDRVVPLSGLDGVLPEADAVILSLPDTPETVGVLSRARIALLPPSAYVVNVGRGSAIDQDALIEALRAGRLAGAALDVMTPEPLPVGHPLWDCPNTILTPHVSGNMSLGLTCDLAVGLFCRNLERYAAGQPLENLIDRAKGY